MTLMSAPAILDGLGLFFVGTGTFIVLVVLLVLAIHRRFRNWRWISSVLLLACAYFAAGAFAIFFASTDGALFSHLPFRSIHFLWGVAILIALNFWVDSRGQKIESDD
jgi:hypothetical protein